MSRLGRFRRGPDQWSSPHARARSRAAERLDGPLGLSESAWLDAHLADCAECAGVAASYELDRQVLRALREPPLEPPRDLWARTAAAIERDRPTDGSLPYRPMRVPFGVLSGIAVVAIVIGASAVSGGLFDGIGGGTALSDVRTPAPGTPGPGSTTAPTARVAAATPFDVGAGEVQWFGRQPDGQLAYSAASIRKVCPMDSPADCATLDDRTGGGVALGAGPRSITGSPTRGHAVVVSDDGAGGQRITIVSLPTPGPTEQPVATPSSPPTPTASVAPTATADESTPTPTGSATPAPTTASVSPDLTASLGPDASVAPSLSPDPGLAGDLAIASDISVVGESAAFSADGSWFAFTARPTDGSDAVGVYVWHEGDRLVRALSTTGDTYFASWAGTEIVASRPGPPSPDGESQPVSILIDPETGTERPAGDLWRPFVDPTGARAVAWVGSVITSGDDGTVVPGTGRVELRPWSSEDEAIASGGATQVVAEGPMVDLDVRWDPSGEWFATWIAESVDSDVGRLTLQRVDPMTGLLLAVDGAPTDVPARPGFSIGEGRLAWATPPGQDGEGSRIRIVAWAPDGVGTVESNPGDGLIIVR